ESVMPRAANKQNPLLQFASNGSLVVQILIGLVAGVILALVSPTAASWVAILGNLFVSALKAVAPVLVLVLLAAHTADHQRGQHTRLVPTRSLYVDGTYAAALLAGVAI